MTLCLYLEHEKRIKIMVKDECDLEKNNMEALNSWNSSVIVPASGFLYVRLSDFVSVFMRMLFFLYKYYQKAIRRKKGKKKLTFSSKSFVLCILN